MTSQTPRGVTGGRVHTRRAMPAADRRQAILAAALEVFAEQGYAQARLDEVARRSGIAKGTIYLHFADKEDLFRTLVTTATKPVIERLEALSVIDVPFEQILTALYALFQTEVLGTRRRDILKLVMTEGGRFPEIAEVYHAQVISRGLPLMRRLLTRAAERGELASDGLVAFPHLIMGPMIVSLFWTDLFDRFEPLDVEGLLRTARSLLTSDRERLP